jgi:hypothetical protein
VPYDKTNNRRQDGNHHNDLDQLEQETKDCAGHDPDHDCGDDYGGDHCHAVNYSQAAPSTAWFDHQASSLQAS